MFIAALASAACSESAEPGSGAQSGDSGGVGVPRLFFLDITGGRVLSAAADGGDLRQLVNNLTALPDGIAVDVNARHIYWTNMGLPAADDGSIERADLDGSNVVTLSAPGTTFTPKQLVLEQSSEKLYWSDREGMRVMRCNLDGSEPETLVVLGEGDTARLDAANWAVGIAVDSAGGYFYWTQKGPDNGYVGTIKRAALELPAGQTAQNRTDVETLFAGLPEPIDLALDLEHRELYWTDRGDNTVSRAPMDPPAGVAAAERQDRTVLATGLNEAIGIALDLRRGQMYVTSLGGQLKKAALDGSGATDLLSGGQGSFTGITFVELQMTN